MYGENDEIFVKVDPSELVSEVKIEKFEEPLDNEASNSHLVHVASCKEPPSMDEKFGICAGEEVKNENIDEEFMKNDENIIELGRNETVVSFIDEDISSIEDSEKCNICHTKFVKKSDIKEHLKFYHYYQTLKPNSEKDIALGSSHSIDIKDGTQMARYPFACHLCDNKYNVELLLIRHLKTHVEKQNFTRTESNKSFKYKSMLVKHKNMHSQEKSHICSKMHSQEKSHICSICGRGIKSRCNLNAHVKTSGDSWLLKYCGQRPGTL